MATDVSLETPVTPFSPAQVVGIILALGVIRLQERRSREDLVDSLTEQSVSTGVLTTTENASD
jgi:hypothetical protein